MSEQKTYTLNELREKYPPRMRTVEKIKSYDDPTLGPLDFVYISDWEDLSAVGADLHKQKRHKCKENVNKFLDIMFVGCQYENKYEEEKETQLKGSMVAIVPYAKMDIDYQILRDALVGTMKERGYGDRGAKPRFEIEDEELEEDE